MRTGIVVAFLLAFNLSDAEGHGRYPRTVAVFHESLVPHGEWVYYGHNVYAWRPVHAPYGWQPYTVGRWVWTADGWYWEPDEPWGWATYHYGRWAYDDYYGWVWIPDLEWGPAWVEWRSGPSCVGWAPMGPRTLAHFSIGFVWGPAVLPVHHWVFVDYRNMVKHKVHHHLLAAKDKKKYYEQTDGKPSGDRRTFGNVPDRRDVERRGNVRVTETKVRKETIEQKRDPAPVPRAADRNEDQGMPRVDSERRNVPDRIAVPQDRTGRVENGRTEPARVPSSPPRTVPNADNGKARVDAQDRSTPGRAAPVQGQVSRERTEASSGNRVAERGTPPGRVEMGKGSTDRDEKNVDDTPGRTSQPGRRVVPER